MKLTTLLVLLVSLGFTTFGQNTNKSVTTTFDKNIELIGYIINLGDPSDNDPEHPITQEIDKYPEDKTNPLLGEIFEIAANMNYSLIINFFYSLPEFPQEEGYEIPEAFLERHGFNTPEEASTMRTLLKKVNQLCKKSGFEAVWSALARYRKEKLKELMAMQPSDTIFLAMEKFYEQKFESYTIIPSLTLWSGPGFGVKSLDGQHAAFVLGPLEKNYDYSDRNRFNTLAIHEFGHSFVNHVVFFQTKDIIDETTDLYTPIKESMTRQGYSNWETSVIEHFVRAGEVLVPEILGDNTTGKGILKDYTENRQFIYLPYIVDRLRHYRMKKSLSYEEAVRKTMLDVRKKYNG